MNNLFNYFAFLLILVSAVACSDYNKIVKGDDYQAKFTRANNLFDDK
jgi:hypothetical protein